MQAVAKQRSVSPNVLIFPRRMGAQATSPLQPDPQPPSGYVPHRHGTWAQWVAPLITLIIGITSVSLMIYYRSVDSSTKASDEHLSRVIGDQTKPLSDKIDTLNDKVGSLAERVARLEGRLGDRVSALEHRADQQAALARLMDPNRVLAAIREEIRTAETSRVAPSTAQLIDYKNAVQAVSPSASQYWNTVAAVINYRSFIDQINHQAPDPSAVSSPCYGLTNAPTITNTHNSFRNGTVSNCIVDLDTNDFQGITFKDSVVRYHGGPVSLTNVRFDNCRFDLTIPVSAPSNPQRDRLLITLFNAPETKAVIISSTHS